MKISNLMRKLEKIKNQKGDIEVCVLEDDFYFGKLKNVQTGYSDKSIRAYMIMKKTPKAKTQMKSNVFVCHYNNREK